MIPEELPSPNATVRLTLDEPVVPRRARRGVYLMVAHRGGIVTVPLAGGAAVVVGREAPADVVIPDEGLSRSHARFSRAADGEEVTVEDLGSTNGTKIGGDPVTRAAVRPGEEVLLGPIAASVHVVAGDDPRPLGLADHEVFRGALAAELTRARYLGRPLAVLMVRALGKPGERLVAWAPRVQAALRPIDGVALYGADVVEILLPEVDRDKALAVGRTLSLSPGRGAALGCGVACFPGAASAEELIEASLHAMRRSTAAQPVQMAADEGHRTLAAGGALDEGDAVVMESPAMRDVALLAARCAKVVAPVVIRGETGTGKEVLARLIHEGGPRRDRPLVAVNCAAIPAGLLESILFGHVKNAFTGALQDKKGLFEEAEGGTLLLDEIGELRAEAQASLLRVLESKQVRRVGDTREIRIDVRVIAATHRDLEAMAEAGTFRSDLLYRLNVMEVSLPPLRERREDIAPLAARFLHAAARANGRTVSAMAPEALALLERHPWPGNVRELRNAVERAVVVAEGETVTPLDLPARVRTAGAPPAATPRYMGSLESRKVRFERETLIEVLREAKNQQGAADLLEMPLRTFQFRLNKHGIKLSAVYGRSDADE